MTSIIDAFNANSALSFSLLSSESTINYDRYKEYAFDKSSKYFETITSPYFWQISFSQSVVVESYIIGGCPTWGATMTSWDISYSNDDKEPIFLQTDSTDSLVARSQKFPLKNKIICKHFKFTARSCNNGLWLGFNQFNIFGTIYLKRTKNRCTCNVAYLKSRLIRNELVAIMILTLVS